MYGLSFTASLLCASATRRFASAIRRAISSVMGGEGLAAAEPEADAGVGVGTADGVPEAVFFIAAIFAAISALFWAMRASPDNCVALVEPWDDGRGKRRHIPLNLKMLHWKRSERAQNGYSA